MPDSIDRKISAQGLSIQPDGYFSPKAFAGGKFAIFWAGLE